MKIVSLNVILVEKDEEFVCSQQSAARYQSILSLFIKKKQWRHRSRKKSKVAPAVGRENVESVAMFHCVSYVPSLRD